MKNEINPVVDNTEHASQKYNPTLESDYFEKNQCCRACNNWQPISHFKLKKKDYICNHCRYTLYEKSIRRLLFNIYRNHTRWASGGIHYSRDQFMKCVYNHEDFHKAYCEWIYTDFSCALRPRYLKIDYRKPFKLDNLYLENIYDSEDKSKTFDPLMINFVKGFIK